MKTVQLRQKGNGDLLVSFKYDESTMRLYTEDDRSEPAYMTLVRYQGRAATKRLMAFVQEERATNKLLSDEERANLRAIETECKIWLQ